MNDDDNDDDADRENPPAVSRLDRGGTRRYRVLTRANGRYRGRDRFPRRCKPIPIRALVGDVLAYHHLTDEIRKRIVCLHWPEIAGERIATKTFPVSLIESVLHVAAVSSSWVHEMQFFKAPLIEQINAWIDANRSWLGPPPLVGDMRFGLGSQTRKWLVDPDHARRLRLQHHLRGSKPRKNVPPIASEAERDAASRETATPAVRRNTSSSRTRENVPPIISEAERDAIRRETRTIADPLVRAAVEALRMKWNR